MGFPSINTREDLDAIAGTPEHDAFMALLSGTLWRLEKDDTAQTWVAIEENSTIERFAFTRSDFPSAQPPNLPVEIPPTPDEDLAHAKVGRAAEVAALKVTTASGKTFDADETAQERMSRAITALDPEEITIWVLADNTPTYITREELREALRLAGEAQTATWVRPYQ